MQSLLIPRKFKFDKSVFYLDYFHLGSWNLTSEIPREKLRGALIVKNTSTRPMVEIDTTEDEESNMVLDTIKNHDYLNILTELMPKTITIAFEEEFQSLTPVTFPFIKKEKEKTASGVTINSDIQWDD